MLARHGAWIERLRRGRGNPPDSVRADYADAHSDPDADSHTDSDADPHSNAIADGIDAARLAGAKVINMSLGGSPPGNQLLSAMQRAVNAGIVLVISAGNDGADPTKGSDPDSFALVPAQTFPGSVIIAGSVGG